MVPLRMALRARSPVDCAQPVQADLDLPAEMLPWVARLRAAGGRDVGMDLRPRDDGSWRLEFIGLPGEHEWLVELDPAATPRFPLAQVMPEPGVACRLIAARETRAAYRHDADGKPVIHPLIGPGGASLTQLGWPPDAEGRTHQHGLWLGHPDVNGANFWSDRGDGRFVHAGFEAVDDGGASGGFTVLLRWVAGGAELLAERRSVRFWLLPEGEALVDLTTSLRAVGGPVRLGRAPFGLLGLRVPRSFWPDRGGRILTSAGAAGELDAQHRRARWCDYSGPVEQDRLAGVAILDHDANAEHPTYWHVREDGWMSAALTFARELVIGEEPLELRYRLVLHAGGPDEARLDALHERLGDPLTATAASADDR